LKKSKYILSMPGDTMYLRAQTAQAQATANQLGVELEILSADMDSVGQGQQLLSLIQSRTSSRPDGIIVEPVSAAGLPRVAEAAVSAGIAWVISNASGDYVGLLRRTAKVPVFLVSQDHFEVGRIQAQQIGAILSQGGSVLYLRGPAMSWWATKRFEGMESARPKNVEVKVLKVLGSTSEAAYKAVRSWLNLSRPRSSAIQLIMSQNADFISGAKQAFETQTAEPERGNWLALPHAGAGLSDRIRPLVDSGTLCAGVVTSLTMETALNMLARATKSGAQPPEQTFVEAYAYPTFEKLAMSWKDRRTVR
jgi:ABC-type sugar transport system substrate-binding protein